MDSLVELGWRDAEESLRTEHRADVLQALAYSTLFDAPRVVACLVYPASPRAWAELVDRDRVLSRARVRAPGRCVEMALLAVPLSGDAGPAARWFERLLREAA